MAAGVRSLLAFWLGGASAGTSSPPPPPPVAPEALRGGWRLTAEQLARLRGGRRDEPDPRRAGEGLEARETAPPALGDDAVPWRWRVDEYTATLGAPDPASAQVAATVQVLAQADLTRRAVLQAQAREEEEALVLMLALLDDL